ncbi:MAG: Helix-turn-helix domain [Gemmataceae bacterium]|nr:Helix-turn-helix domain [Gemmataceae bacterium]
MDLLRSLLEEAGLTQQQLAEKAGPPLGRLRNHEQGQRLPSWAAGVKLAHARGVPTGRFAVCDEVTVESEHLIPKRIARKT